MKRTTIAIAVIASGLSSALALADTMYVSDKLVVNVYPEPNQDGRKVAILDSGDTVEALEKSDSFTHVRLADNREGWIKSSYLSTQVPAIVRLKELEKERAAGASTLQTAVPASTTQSSDEARQLKERNVALQAEIASLKQTVEAEKSKAAAALTTSSKKESASVPAPTEPSANAPQGQLEGAELSHPNATAPTSGSVGIGAALILVGGAIGYLLGYQTIARRIRRKYGNVRIY